MTKIYQGWETIKALQEGMILTRKNLDNDDWFIKMVDGELFCRLEDRAWERDYLSKHRYPVDEILKQKFKQHIDNHSSAFNYNFSKAVSTFLELRTHHYARKIVGDELQFFIEARYPINDKDSLSVDVDGYRTLNCKLNLLSPAFKSVLEAGYALREIGEGRLINMFKVLQGLK